MGGRGRAGGGQVQVNPKSRGCISAQNYVVFPLWVLPLWLPATLTPAHSRGSVPVSG